MIRGLKLSVLTVGVCLLWAMGVEGQTQNAGGHRAVDAARPATRPVEPDSPATSSTPASNAQAIVPRLMKFSGALHDPTGKPVTGAVDVTFALYSVEAGGNPLWFETQSVQADEQGRYTALLGAMHTDGLPMDLFTSGEVRWLGIQVGLEAEQQPRVLLVSVPYALKAGDAETLGGRPASAYMLSDAQRGSSASNTDGLVSGTSKVAGSGKSLMNRTANASTLTACTTITSSGTAPVNYFSKFTSACNIEPSGVVEANGDLGVGTAAPTSKLTVADNVGVIQLELQSSNAGNGANLFLNNMGTANGGKFLRSWGGNFQVVNDAYSKALLTIQDGGNVGIGTAAPSAKLHVVDSSNLVQFELQSAAVTGANLFLKNTGAANGGKFIRSLAGNLQVINNAYSAALLTIQDGGNVGIGTAAPVAKLDVAGSINSAGIVTAGSFVGSGAGLTNLSASSLSGGLVVLQNPTSPNIIAGFSGNTVSGGVLGATISGGGFSGNINSVAANYGTVGGGNLNIVSGHAATVSGGHQNTASGAYSVVGGGANNVASGIFATVIGGGTFNTASGNQSTIPGGGENVAMGDFSFAAGYGAQANHAGSFVWADDPGAQVNFATTGVNQFLIRASGGVGIGTASPGKALDVAGDIRASGCFLAGATIVGGTCSSDARFKTNIQPFSPVLARLVQLQPVHFNWKVAEYPDYHFESGRSSGVIAQQVEKVFPELITVDAKGFKQVNYSELPFLMLGAIRELKAENDSLKAQVKLQEARLNLNKDEQIQRLAQEVEELKRSQKEQISKLASQLSNMQATLKANRQDSAVRVAKVHSAKTYGANGQAIGAASGSGR